MPFSLPTRQWQRGLLVVPKKFFFSLAITQSLEIHQVTAPVDWDKSNTPHSALKLKAQSDGSLCRIHFFYFIFNNSLACARAAARLERCGSLPLFFRWLFQTAPLSIIWAASWLLSNWCCSRFIILVSHDRSDTPIQNLQPTFNQSDHDAAEPIISATNLRGPQALNRVTIVHHWGCDGNWMTSFVVGIHRRWGSRVLPSC